MENTVTRKDFFKQAFDFFKNEMESGVEKKIEPSLPFFLPPGVENIKSFLEICEQCYECVAACPHESIRVWRGDNHNEFYGFPIIEPRTKPCYECSDYPCIAACPSGGLSKDFENRKMGTAVIHESICFAFQSHFCHTCYNNCPYPEKAIKFDNNNRPEIINEGCTGCGICTHTCPAETPALTINMDNEQ